MVCVDGEKRKLFLERYVFRSVGSEEEVHLLSGEWLERGGFEF